MQVKGALNLLGNLLQNANLEASQNWPTEDPGVGRLLLRQEGTNTYRFYISGGLESGVRVWMPVTQEITLFVHDQASASTAWTIPHNLNTAACLIQIQNTSNQPIMYDEVSFLYNEATVEFSVPQAGRAILMMGSQEGAMRPNVAFENSYTNQATWTVNHGLGYEPIIRTFIGNQEVQPLSITHTDENTAVVQFSSPQTGRVKCI